jgi:hypothetical protein
MYGTLGDPLVSGYWTLNIAHRGTTYTTDPIPWNAANMLVDETGIDYPIDGVVFSVRDGNSTISTSMDATKEVFVGDRIVFPATVDIHADAVYEVKRVYYDASMGTFIDLDIPVELKLPRTTSDISISRRIGGRGLATDSYITCDADNNLCDLSRRKTSGSFEGKIKSTGALEMGVLVDRDVARDSTGGIKIRIKILDNSPATENYQLSVDDNKLITVGNVAATIDINPLIIGESYSSCSGTFEMPSANQALAVGQEYYGRVFAKNDIGYGPSMTSPTSEKPQVVPGAPTAVILTNVDSSILMVTWNPPAFDGGAEVTSYLITYSLESDYSGASTDTVSVTYLTDGAPFRKSLKDLIEGSFYYVKIQACNDQGCGDATGSVPLNLNPHTVPSMPSNVILKVVSDSAINVAFDVPVTDGGDTVEKFYIAWDTTSNLNSAAISMPHKGYVEVDAATYRSYTIHNLQQGQEYFVKVGAKNSAGLGALATPSTPSVTPVLVIPGRASSAQAYTGSTSGSIKVQWNFPIMPWFGYPCFGSIALGTVYECPKAYGGGLPMATGGLKVNFYEIRWSEKPDFMNDYDTGMVTTNDLTYTVTGLIPGRTYYFRVYTRNNVGPSPAAKNTGEYGEGSLISAVAAA